MHSIKEVAPDIFMITQAITQKHLKSSVNLFVIAGKDGLVFDSGYGGRQKKSCLVNALGKISHLKKSRGEACVITRAMPSHGHWDHFSGLGHLQDALGLEILATQKQAKKIGSKKSFKDSFREDFPLFNPPTPKFFEVCHNLGDSLVNELFMKLARVSFVSGPINIIDENTQLTVNGEPWQVIPVPGHCDDDIVLYNRERGILLGGDIILRRITTWLGPPRSNLKDYLKSLELLMKLPNLKLILPAHGSSISNPVKRIQGAIDHREKRTKDLFLLLLRSGKRGLSFGEIFHAFYPKSPLFKRSLLEGWILVTLQYLFEKGDIITSFGGRNMIFKTRA